MAYAYLTPYRRGVPAGTGGNGSIFDLHRQMNRMFDDLLTDSEGGRVSSGVTGWPSLDIVQNDEKIEVCAELAGVNRDDISIDVNDGMLTISGEKNSRCKNDDGYSERVFGRFERRVSLPANVDEVAIEADFEDGLLTVTLPLAEERYRGRKIELGHGKSKGRDKDGDRLIEGRSEASGKKAKRRESENA